MGFICFSYGDGRLRAHHAPMFRMPCGAGNLDPLGAGIGAGEVPLGMLRMPGWAYRRK